MVRVRLRVCVRVEDYVREAMPAVLLDLWTETRSATGVAGFGPCTIAPGGAADTDTGTHHLGPAGPASCPAPRRWPPSPAPAARRRTPGSGCPPASATPLCPCRRAPDRALPQKNMSGHGLRRQHPTQLSRPTASTRMSRWGCRHQSRETPRQALVLPVARLKDATLRVCAGMPAVHGGTSAGGRRRVVLERQRSRPPGPRARGRHPPPPLLLPLLVGGGLPRARVRRLAQRWRCVQLRGSCLSLHAATALSSHQTGQSM